MTGAPIIIETNTYYQSRGTYLVDGQPLAAGGIVTVSGTTISLDSSGSRIAINGVTQELGVYTPMMVGHRTVFGVSGTFIIEGQTVAPRQVIVVDGTTISVSPEGTLAIIDGQTVTLTTTKLGGTATGSSEEGNSTKSSAGSISSCPIFAILAMILHVLLTTVQAIP